MITKLYRSIVPLSVRQRVYDQFLGRLVFFARHADVIARSKFTTLFQSLLPRTAANAAFAFIGRHGITSYPGDYAIKYRSFPVRIYRDEAQKLPFVLHHDRKLFFPAFYTDEKILRDYRALLTEQDIESAHRYVRSYDELKDRTLLDIGAAEGIFALDSIEQVRKVVLFECMDYWQAPLRATFGPWLHKVEIVPRFVGATSDNSQWISIDNYLAVDASDSLFIKMDIEGGEREALAGASRVLASNSDIQVAVCTYHRPGDPEFLQRLLERNNFVTEFTPGVMYWNKRVSQGVIRGRKTKLPSV
ncbi:MAG: hypothetical protein ACK5DD_03610 [Cyclobacteriaceae bacterium]|jgi:hypothetical protein